MFGQLLVRLQFSETATIIRRRKTHDMREVLYVSERKLDFMFLDAEQRTWRPHVIESSVGVPGVADVKVVPARRRLATRRFGEYRDQA